MNKTELEEKGIGTVEALEDFVELFNEINLMADDELGWLIGGYAFGPSNPFYDISEHHVRAATNQLILIMNDSELASHIDEFYDVVRMNNENDTLYLIEQSDAYKKFCKEFQDMGLVLIENYIKYIEECGLPKKMPEWEGGGEVLAMYKEMKEKYNA